MRTVLGRLGIFAVIVVILVVLFGTADWSKPSCQPMGLKGVGQFEGGLYTQTWGGQAYRYDFPTEKWQPVPFPNGTSLYKDVKLPDQTSVELQSDGFTVQVGNKFSKICN